MAKVDFDSLDKERKGSTKSYEIEANTIAKKLMQKMNLKVLAIVAIYFILFGLVSNIWLMFSETKIYFTSLIIASIIFSICLVFVKIKNKSDGRKSK